MTQNIALALDNIGFLPHDIGTMSHSKGSMPCSTGPLLWNIGAMLYSKGSLLFIMDAMSWSKAFLPCYMRPVSSIYELMLCITGTMLHGKKALFSVISANSGTQRPPSGASVHGRALGTWSNARAWTLVRV